MRYATKIHMNSGYENSYILTDIDTVFIEGEKFYKKADLYDDLKRNPGSIRVKRDPYPDLLPALSSKNEKYVRSEPNDSERDNLLKLPRV
ncbi:MAG: DUF3892 domain-containing protein [Saccharofermentanales bacterium]